MRRFNNSNSNNLLLGALATSLLVGGAAVLLFKSNAGRRIKRKLSHRVGGLKDTVEDYFGSIANGSREIIDDINETASDWTERARELLNYITENVEALSEPKHRELRFGFLIGILVGGVLGAGGIKLIGNLSENGEGYDFLKNISSKASSWRKVIGDIQDILEEKAQSMRGRKRHGGGLNEVIDFASAGMQLWNNIRGK